MEVTFIDVKDEKAVSSIQLTEGEALMGLNLDADGKVTKDGVPQHRLYLPQKVVSFGIQRFQKQEERNSLASVAAQALAFRMQNPKWEISRIYRPIYDINPDDTLAAAILDPELGPILQKNSIKAHALASEIALWNANKYIFAKSDQPSLLNNALNEFPYPFKDMPGKSRQMSCEYYFYDLEAWFADNIENLEPTSRIFPVLKYEILFRNEASALILVESERYGSDDLIAQLFFQANPTCSRIVLVKRIHKSVKHAVTIVNAELADSKMLQFNYPNIKELNFQEKRSDGDPSWKNLKLTTIGPKKGSALSFEVIWDLTKINL